MEYDLTIKEHGLTTSDWSKNYNQDGSKHDVLSNLAFSITQKTNELKNMALIKTSLNQNLIKELLNDRKKGITYWRNVIKECVNNLEDKIRQLKEEKHCSNKDLQNIHLRFELVNDCISRRCNQESVDLCYDLIDNELRKEYHLLELIKNKLSEENDEAYVYCTKLTELLGTLEIDIMQKNEAIIIEENTEGLASDSLCLSLKPQMNHSLNYISFESWLENCKFLQQQTRTELEKCNTLTQKMRQSRMKAQCEILAQFDVVNFSYRKRIFEFERAIEELNWQKTSIQEKKDKLMHVIESLKGELMLEFEALKLFQSQSENRIYRVEKELCQEMCTDNLNEQIMITRKDIDMLEKQLERLKKTYNLLDKQIMELNMEIKNKSLVCAIDKRCSQMRNEFHLS